MFELITNINDSQFVLGMFSGGVLALCGVALCNFLLRHLKIVVLLTCIIVVLAMVM